MMALFSPVKAENLTRPSPSSPASLRVHASQGVIDSLRLSSFQKGEDAEGPCPVCQIEYEEGEKLAHLPCSHIFHQACINKWLGQYSKKCPVCKGEVC